MTSAAYSPVYRPFTFGQPWTPMVRALILANSAVFLAQLALSRTVVPARFSLQVPEVFASLRLWQPLTYMFLHAGIWHLAFNMFALWMFGVDVEKTLGPVRFLWYYLACGWGAGWCVAGVGWLAGEHSATLGASGAIFGILMAYGRLFADRTVTLLIFFILPVRLKARTMVLLFGIFEFLAGVGNVVGRVSHVAHLSGLLVGYIIFQMRWQPAGGHAWWQGLRGWWRRRAGSRPETLDAEAQLDRILEKISKSGIGSLSQRERDVLTEASRLRRQQGREN